ncbi:MAG TPA: cytochrome C oxidase subunit IV family protein [Gemmatimonadales bacterium]|nr:cytochrome C oxidase subunit IV family protein [Gemmatimonadales bacterium]
METAHRQHPPYIRIWIYLALLTAAELLLAFKLPIPPNIKLILLLGTAVWKALLVALFFMHLKSEKWNLRILAMVPLPLAAILVCAVITEKIW